MSKEYPIKTKIGRTRIVKGTYTSEPKRCDLKRKNCPAQLLFVAGQPYIQLCGRTDTAIAVDTAEEAMKAAKKLCKSFAAKS